VTAGASAPESLVREVVARLRAPAPGSCGSWRASRKNMVFALPKALRAVVLD
jgi:hypothetical protein